MYDEDGAVQALTAQSQLGVDKPVEKISSFAGSWSAAAKAIPAAAAETARAFNQVATPSAVTDEKRQRLAEKFGSDFAEREAESRADAIQSHENIGSSLGKFAKSMAPDPQSTGAAAQIIHGVTKSVGKAVGYAVTGGLPAVAIGMSTDEGINESLRLQDAGVDQATANKAGLVRAGTTAVSTALPGVGQTLAKTVGLVLTAGPAAFMADQAAIGSILENANYKDKAAEYDPFDMTNLILSLAPGAVVGGIHLRGVAKAKARAGEAAIRDASEVGAKEEVTVANDVSGITAAAEKEAAARVMQTDYELQAKALTPADDLVGQMNHQKAIDAVARQFDEGAPLDVQNIVHRDLANGKFAEVPELAPMGERVAAIDESVARTGEIVARVDENGTSAGKLVQQDLPPIGEPRPATTSLEDLTRVIDDRIEDTRLDQPIVIGKADDGTPITSTGRELLQDVEQQKIQADNDSKAYMAAIECFISSGDIV